MNYLESNGYSNVTGLKRQYAIEVEDFDEKEKLLDNIFSKSRVGKSELFALDIGLVIKLLSSLEGKQICPGNQNKEEVFEKTKAKPSEKQDLQAYEPAPEAGESADHGAGDGNAALPDGTYSFEIRRGPNAGAEATMEVRSGKCIVLAGSSCCPADDEKA